MPKIKSPISQAERDYNKRYEKETQKVFCIAVHKATNTRAFLPNEYTRNFLERIRITLSFNEELTEKQADFLAELYDKYTD